MKVEERVVNGTFHCRCQAKGWPNKPIGGGGWGGGGGVNVSVRAPREINPMFNGDLRKLLNVFKLYFPSMFAVAQK